MSDSLRPRSRADQPIIVVGADGMLGSRLAATFDRERQCVWGSTRNRSKVAANRPYLDLSADVRQFAPPFRGVGTAILCAAQTSISRCEREQPATRRINVDNTVSLAENLVDAGIFVIFISSNTVFDGSMAFPAAGDLPNPQHEYGRQKAEAEAKLLKLGPDIAVIRFSKIIAPEMPLFSGWMRDLRAGKTIHPFSDAVMAPLSAEFAISVICRVEAFKRPGVIQASASEDITYGHAARYLAKSLAADLSLVEPVSCETADFAGFPAHTTMDCRELTHLGLEAPSPTHALDHFMQRVTHG